MKVSVNELVSNLSRAQTDVLVLGSGGAGLLTALHAHDRNSNLNIVVASKGLIGKSGCTRMVQGGYNVALAEGDSIEQHFEDTIKGGKWINHQELAWTLVSTAAERLVELEIDTVASLIEIRTVRFTKRHLQVKVLIELFTKVT